VKIGDKVEIKFDKVPDEQLAALASGVRGKNNRGKQKQGAKRLGSGNYQTVADTGTIVGILSDESGERYQVRVNLKNGPPNGRLRLIDGEGLTVL